MTSRDFAFWLQGFFELSETQQNMSAGGIQIANPPMTLSGEQVRIVKRHLALVFVHEIDPSMGDKVQQDKLNKIHGPVHGGDPIMRC